MSEHLLADDCPERDAVRDYLDGAITNWRRKRDAAEEGRGGFLDRRRANDYIDAFQSVRLSLLGELLP